MPRSISTSDLEKMIEHLFYEVQMLEMSASLLGIGMFGQDPVKNALLESFTTHSRSIIYFLYPPENMRPDDVIAQDFVRDGIDWTAIRPAKPRSLQDVHFRVGKEIAHLTYARNNHTEQTKAWKFIEIAKDILMIFNKLLENKKPLNYGHFLEDYLNAKGFPIEITINQNQTTLLAPRVTKL